MDKLENGAIVFDNVNGVYKPGEFVRGQVLIKLNSSKEIKGVSIKFVGKSTVYWSESGSTTNPDGTSSSTSTSHTNEEIYFKHKFYAVCQENGGKVLLRAGQHVFPFQYLLPFSIPSSFEENTAGKIIYSVKATLERPWKIDKHVERPFIVDALANIHNHLKAKLPGVLRMEKKFGIILRSKPLKTEVEIKHSGLIPGQTIPLIVSVNNYSDNHVYCISFKLRQVLTFHAKNKNKTYEKTLTKNYYTTEIRRKRCRSFSHSLMVPADLRIYDLTYCNIIDCHYALKVELYTFNLYKNLVGKLPLYPVNIIMPQSY